MLNPGALLGASMSIVAGLVQVVTSHLASEGRTFSSELFAKCVSKPREQSTTAPLLTPPAACAEVYWGCTIVSTVRLNL